MERNFWKRAEQMTPEERSSGCNLNMMRDGQLPHDMNDTLD